MRPIPTSTCAIFKKQLQYFYNIMKGGEGAQRGMGGYIESKLDILDGVKPDGVWVKVECTYTHIFMFFDYYKLKWLATNNGCVPYEFLFFLS